MIRLIPIIFGMAGATLAGAAVTAWLVVPELQQAMSIWLAAAIGFAAAPSAVLGGRRRLTAGRA